MARATRGAGGARVMDVAAQLLAGKVAAGARAIRWLDDRDPRARDVLRRIFAATGRAHIIGVTGPPGAGKSTLVDGIVAEERRRGRRVGVLAIDPTSPFTGGAILGDRVRMSRHALDEGVFIRSMGTRGESGGLSRATYDAALVMDAMGYEVVIVETVGVGQEEIDIVALAHSTIIVCVPGLGDEVQAMKAGLLEAGEILVLNKADREGFDQTWRHLELLLHLRGGGRVTGGGWAARLLPAVATRNEGAAAIVAALDEHRRFLEDSGEFARQCGRRSERQFLALARAALMEELLCGPGAELLTQVRARRLDPYTAAEQLSAQLRAERTPR
ncbi:MAG: methylmalonyl Co-A mutase-associated GTPase MeaB [Steroidobacteraceae bacterium]